MKSITVQLKVNIVNQIEGIKEDGLEFTGLYVDESNTDFTDIAIMYEEDGVENGDIWEIQGDELVIVEYGLSTAHLSVMAVIATLKKSVWTIWK